MTKDKIQREYEDFCRTDVIKLEMWELCRFLMNRGDTETTFLLNLIASFDELSTILVDNMGGDRFITCLEMLSASSKECITSTCQLTDRMKRAIYD